MQPIFSRNVDYNKIAFLNWRISKDKDILNMINIADGYLTSAISLARLSLTSNKDKKADILIFAILNNANHGIELYLKSICHMLNILLEQDTKPLKGHNIKMLYEVARSKVKEYKSTNLTLKQFILENKGLHAYIEELFTKLNANSGTDKMDFSRYPFDKSFTNHFYVDYLGNVEVDLENFVIRFEEIHQNLETLSEFLYYQEILNED